MSRNGDVGGDAATFSPSAARDDVVALLRLAGLDAELDQSAAAILELLGRQREDLPALGELIEKDPPQGTAQQGGEILDALQRKTADLAEQRESVLAGLSLPLRRRYEAAARKGQHPALVAMHDGRCPGCGETLPEASRRLVQQSLRVVPCSGCLRLLYDRSWTERNLIPSTLRPVTRRQP